MMTGNVLTQGVIDFRLIPAPLARLILEPRDNIRIQPQRKLLFDGPIKLASLRPRPILNLRDIAGVDILIRHIGESLQI